MTNLVSGLGELRIREPRDEARPTLPNVVQDRILPQLMASYGIGEATASRPEISSIKQKDVALFCALVAGGDSASLTRSIADLRSRGVSNDDMMLGLLPMVAHELGRRWTKDESDFASVTIAMGHLLQLRREITRMPGQALLPVGAPRRALLAPSPGEQHNFGILIVDHFLHQAGWEVTTLPQGNADEISRRVNQDYFEIAGLSLSCEAYLMTLEKLVATIRRSSRNRDIGIIVGGRLFLEKPDLALLIGADGAASDGRDAVKQAERLAADALSLQTTD